MTTTSSPNSALFHSLPEAIIRLSYYGYISYIIFKTTFDFEIIDSTIIFGGSIVYMMIQLFLIHHFLKGLQLLLRLTPKFYPLLNLCSICGLIFLIGVLVKYGIMEKAPLHEPNYLIPMILLIGTVAYLFYKEIKLLVANKNLIFNLLRSLNQ